MGATLRGKTKRKMSLWDKWVVEMVIVHQVVVPFYQGRDAYRSQVHWSSQGRGNDLDSDGRRC